MPRTLPQIITHVRATVRAAVGDSSISTTLIQTEDLTALCDAAQHYLDSNPAPTIPLGMDDEYNGTHAFPDEN